MEAALEDVRLGYKENAHAANILAHHSPSNKADTAMQTKPCTFADDGKGMLIDPPRALEWTDMYVSWNMCFISHFQNFPAIMAKLLIPQVLNYREHLETYLYKRAIALFCMTNHGGFMRADCIEENRKIPKWYTPKLTRIWSKVNAANADRFEQHMQECLQDSYLNKKV